MCLYADFSLLPFHTAFYLLFSQFHVPLHPPPCSHTHSVFKSKGSPCVMQAVSLRSHFDLPPLSVSLLPPPSPECLDRSKWCDCDCSAGRLPLHVCLSASLESLTWAEGEEEGKRQRAREREGKVLLNNKAWRPSREPSLASGVSLSSGLSLFLYLCLSALSLYSSHSPTLSF